MPRTMSFIPKLKGFLKVHGTIYTVRKYRMVDNEVVVDGLEGVYTRNYLGEVKCLKDLEPYVKESGFKAVQDWQTKIAQFVAIWDTRYLYKVSKKDV